MAVNIYLEIFITMKISKKIVLAMITCASYNTPPYLL